MYIQYYWWIHILQWEKSLKSSLLSRLTLQTTYSCKITLVLFHLYKCSWKVGVVVNRAVITLSQERLPSPPSLRYLLYRLPAVCLHYARKSWALCIWRTHLGFVWVRFVDKDEAEKNLQRGSQGHSEPPVLGYVGKTERNLRSCGVMSQLSPFHWAINQIF